MIKNYIQYEDISETLTKHETKKYKHRDIARLECIMIHHSATSNGSAESFARYHVNNNDWPAIGYHFVGDDSGIHQTNKITDTSYHCAGYLENGRYINGASIGICHKGHFDNVAPTDQEYLNYIQMVLLVDSMIGKQLPIIYHSNYSPKTCPGTLFDRAKFEMELKEFRQLFI